MVEQCTVFITSPSVPSYILYHSCIWLFLCSFYAFYILVVRRFLSLVVGIPLFSSSIFVHCTVFTCLFSIPSFIPYQIFSFLNQSSFFPSLLVRLSLLSIGVVPVPHCPLRLVIGYCHCRTDSLSLPSCFPISRESNAL